HGSLEPQVATWGFSSVRNFFDFSQVGFSKASGLSSDSLQRGAPESTLRAIGSMSPPDYSLARLRPRRAALRFTRRTQLTNQPIQPRFHLDQTQHSFYSRQSRRRWFGACSCKPTPRGLPSSVKQLRTSLAFNGCVCARGTL